MVRLTHAASPDSFDARLLAEYRRIGEAHKRAIKRTVAEGMLGASILRVFSRGTKDDVVPVLLEIDFDALHAITSQVIFDSWFDAGVSRVAAALRIKNASKRECNPGIEWGHAAKIMSIFVRDIVERTAYFDGSTRDRLMPLLYNPLDSRVFNRLKELGWNGTVNKIKDVAAREDFYGLQETLGRAAREAGVPRVWFDDVWGEGASAVRQGRSTEP